MMDVDNMTQESPKQTAQPAIDVRGVTKIYEGGSVGLHQLNLIVPKGEWYCLLGENGAGKTTLVNLLLGFLRPTEGTIRIQGYDIQNEQAKARRCLAYVPENVRLYENLTARQNLEFFTAISGIRPSGSDYDQMLEYVRLKKGAFDQLVKHFSNGMRQKLGVAVALMKGASTLLLDEPTSGLDPKDGLDIMHTFADCQKAGSTIFMVSHDLVRISQFADRLGVMKSGRLVAERGRMEDTPAELYKFYLEHILSPLEAKASVGEVTSVASI